MKNMSNCPKHGMYPNRFDSCPRCSVGAKSGPSAQLSTAEHISRMSNEQVRCIFQNIWWENGDEEARRLCLAEYDKRIGLENWPAHISKEVA